MQSLHIRMNSFLSPPKKFSGSAYELPVIIKRNFLSRVARKEKTCLSDTDSFDSFQSKLFAKVISCFKSFSPNEYDLRILSSVFLIEIFDLRGKEVK